MSRVCRLGTRNVVDVDSATMACFCRRLNAIQRHVGQRGQRNLDWVAWPDSSAGPDDRHDAGLADEPSIGAPLQDGREQTRLKLFDLLAGIS